MQLSEIGKLAQKYWLEIPTHFPFVELGNFVVMPNHFHGILIIDKTEPPAIVEIRQSLVSTIVSSHETIGQSRFQNQGKNTISSIVGSYKSIVTKTSRYINPDFSTTLFAMRMPLKTFRITLQTIRSNGKKIPFGKNNNKKIRLLRSRIFQMCL